jgi:hypothetical protein
MRSGAAKIVSFCRRGGGRFARLNFVEYIPVTAPEEDLDRTVRELEQLIDTLNPEWIAPCDDAALFALSHAKGAKAQRLLPSVTACGFAMDKYLQVKLAADIGFSVPYTRLVNTEADLSDFDCRPAILKPRAAIDVIDGRLEKGSSFVVRGDVQPEVLETIANRSYLMQEYKNGVGEGFFGIAWKGEIYGAFGHRRVRMMNPTGSGASACVSRTPEKFEHEAATRFIRRIEWRGPFMLEFLRDRSGRAWFMEFNGRFWGSLALARRCGLDIPRLALDLTVGRPVFQAEPAINTGFARHLGRDLINLLFIFRGPPDGVRSEQWPSRLSAVRQFVMPHHLRSFYNYDPTQPLFFVKDAIYTLSNALRGRKS